MSRTRPITGWKIPGDWDGEDWACIELQWPNSPEYLQFLRDILYMLTRGRSYARDTGTIVEAQSVGWEIFDRNRPFIACGSDCPECDDCPEPTIEELRDRCASLGFGGIVVESEESMGQVVTDAYIENGDLVVEFGKCCIKRFPLGASIEPVEGEDVPTVPTEPTPEPIDQACRDAWAYAKTTQLFANELWDILDSGLSPNNMLSQLYLRFPFLLRGKWSAAQFLLEAGVVQAALEVLGLNVYITDTEAQQFACALYPVFDSYAGISQSEHDAARDLCYAVFGNDHNGSWCEKLLEFVKQECMTANVVAFVHDTEPDCICVPGSEDPTDAWSTDWSIYIDMRSENPTSRGWNFLGDSVWTSGEGVQDDPDDLNGYHTPGIEIPILSPSADNVITHCWVEYEAHAGFDYSDGPGVKTDDTTIISNSQKPDGDPSVGGVYINQRTGVAVTTLNALWVRWEAKGYNPVDHRDLSDSWTLRRFAIGGTGSNPFEA